VNVAGALPFEELEAFGRWVSKSRLIGSDEVDDITAFRLNAQSSSWQPTVTFTIGCSVSFYLDRVAIGAGLKRRASISNSPISTSRKNTL
jgi:hypothetical protein